MSLEKIFDTIRSFRSVKSEILLLSEFSLSLDIKVRHLQTRQKDTPNSEAGLPFILPFYLKAVFSWPSFPPVPRRPSCRIKSIIAD